MSIGRVRKLVAGTACIAVAASGLAGVSSPAAAVTDEDPDFKVNRADLEFILKQIKISEAHAAGGELLCEDPADQTDTCVPDPRLPFGLRTVDGSFNNLQPGQSKFGAGSQTFPRLLEPEFKDAENLPFDPDGPNGPAQSGVPTSYAQKSGFVADSEPRIISNLIVDQTANNPAALEAMAETPESARFDHDNDPATPDHIFIPNVSPDEGLSAPFNSWFTLFGQFFDHGLDLVSKGGSGTVAVPLQPDDPLYDHSPGARTNFLMLSRATNQPGPDGVLGTDDDLQEHTNRTTPWTDQNQTYTSHPSHQAFLREYEATPEGPVPTGHLLDGAGGGLATWTDIKNQARDLLGIELDDMDVLNVPLLATDPYGRFIPGENGYPQLVVDGTPRTMTEGDPAAPVDATDAMEANHAFLDDIAHAAVPNAEGTHDVDLLGSHYATGDGRGNENVGLTAVHHVFHSEHNRLVGHVEDVLNATGDQEFIDAWHDESGPWDYGERLFQAARFVTEMEYQHLVFEEFARKIQPSIDVGPLNETLYHSDIDPAVAAEFAHVVYRFGHSMLTDTVAREGWGTEDLALLEGFLNPAALTDNGRLTMDQGAAAVIQGMTRQTGNGIDEFVDDTLRNNLLGLPLDLATINMARARETGVPSLQTARQTFYAETHNAALKPYESWEDFRLAMKHRGSIVNFVAAYGNHDTIAAAETVAEKREAASLLVAEPAFMNLPAAESGLNDVDFWMGGLAERAMVFGGMLGTTFNAVFESHLENLQNGDRFYYLTRTQGMNLIHQLEANSFSELVLRNTDASLLPGDIFASPDAVYDLGAMDPLPEGFSRMNDGTYRYDGEEHVVIHGTDAADRMRGSDGDDSLWGHDGPDHLEGDVGNDVHHGGKGDDVITDLFGDDTIHGGSGEDAINAGPGLDLVFGGGGRDFILHGQEITQSFAGGGDDLVRGGDANDILTGNEGDDWLEGGRGHDLVQGDNALTFQNDPNGGADVFFGGPGNDDHDAEGGDDIMLNNGIDRHAGMMGFDWVTHKHDPLVADSDLDVTIFQPPDVTAMRSRFMDVEGLSGWDGDDILRGVGAQDDNDGTNHELTQEHLDRVVGLRALLGGGAEPTHATPFMTANEANNIILGGAGSDLLEGRAGDDFIDGDAALDVYLRGPDNERQETMQPFQARIFDGTLKPGDISIVREVIAQEEADDVIDTAVFSDVRASYQVTENADGTVTLAHDGEDGVDTLRNVERLTFADRSVDIEDLRNTPATGTVELSTDSPVEGEQVTARRAFEDADGVDADSIVYTWQVRDEEGSWSGAAAGVGPTFTPTNAEVGSVIRVVATFQDDLGITETITSAPTNDPVQNVNQPATGAPSLGAGTPVVGTGIAASVDDIADEDGMENADLDYQWQERMGTSSFIDVPDATQESYTPTADLTGHDLRVVVTFTDDQGTEEVLTSAPTEPVIGFPGRPVIGTAEAGDASATVHWSPPAGDGGSAITSYRVVVRQGVDVVQMIDEIPSTATSVVVNGLTNGTEYRFQVRAVNDVGPGGYSDASNYVTPASVDSDAAAPTLVSQLPEPQATGVGRNANVTVRLSEEVTGVNAESVTLRRRSNGALMPATVTYDASSGVVALEPKGRLASRTRYTVTLSSAIKDSSGNALPTTRWWFTSADTRAPKLTALTPRRKARDVKRGSNVRARFTEKVVGVNGRTVTLRRGARGAVVPARVSYNARTRVVTLNPSKALPSRKRFTVTVRSPIRDAAGNRMRTVRWGFNTADTKAPKVVARSPRGGGVARMKNVTARFTEKVKGVHGRSVVLRRASNGARIGAVVSYNAKSRVVRLNPKRRLPARTRFTVTVRRPVRDIAGNRVSTARWSFTTRR